MEEIDEQNWEYAHRLFQCVAAASRPLRVEELAEFLAFDFEAGSTPTFLADWRSEDPENEVLSICSTLLVVVKRRRGSPVIQFAHFSVKEYLTSARLARTKTTISRFHVSMTPAHTIVAQACLAVLLHLDENITKGSLKEFPLAGYAAEHWVVHSRFEYVSSKVQDGMKRLFDPSKIHLSVWLWICDPEAPWRRSQRSKRPEKPRATPLHYAAVCNTHEIATFLIVEHSQDVNALGFDDEETPLLDSAGYTPLHSASKAGRLTVARVLLSHGADVTAQSEDNETPLHRAKDEEVSQLFLEHGADANALDINNRTPLHGVSELAFPGAARVLLEHGVDAKARDAKNATPLHLASGSGYQGSYQEEERLDVVRLLLQYGADIHARDDGGQTPFMRATAKRRHEIMQLLSEHGGGLSGGS